MKITVDVDPERFDDFYERVLAYRQEKNGRTVNRAEARRRYRAILEYLLDDATCDVTNDFYIEEFVDELDEEIEKLKKSSKLYAMVKDYTPVIEFEPT